MARAQIAQNRLVAQRIIYNGKKFLSLFATKHPTDDGAQIELALKPLRELCLLIRLNSLRHERKALSDLKDELEQLLQKHSFLKKEKMSIKFIAAQLTP